MASSRRTGTNENVSTYGSGGLGRDYTVFATWEAATDNDLVTATTSEVLECYDDAASFDDYMVMAGATTSASYRRIVRPADGEGHDGTPNNGFTVSSTTDAPVIRIDEDLSQVQDLILSLNINSANNRAVIGGPGSQYGVIGCLVVDSANSGSGVVNGIWMWGSSGLGKYAVNCVVHNIGNHGVYVEGSVYYRVYNCTINYCGNTGAYSAVAAGLALLKNTVIHNCTVSTIQGNWTSTTSVTDGTVPTYVDSGGDDFHLHVTDTLCRGNGTDLSADGNYAFDDDIDGESRGGWDIGFDEYVPEFLEPNEMIIELVSDASAVMYIIEPNESHIDLISENINMYGYIEPVDTHILLVCDSPATAHIVIDWSIASTAYKELTTAYTAFVAFQGAYDGQVCTLILAQDGSGSREVSLPSNVRDNDDVSTPLSLSTDANYVDYVRFVYRADIDKYDILSFVTEYH